MELLKLKPLLEDLQNLIKSIHKIDIRGKVYGIKGHIAQKVHNYCQLCDRMSILGLAKAIDMIKGISHKVENLIRQHGLKSSKIFLKNCGFSFLSLAVVSDENPDGTPKAEQEMEKDTSVAKRYFMFRRYVAIIFVNILELFLHNIHSEFVFNKFKFLFFVQGGIVSAPIL